MILEIAPRPKSYGEFRSVDGVIYPTVEIACNARGLLNDDREWITYFLKAARFSFRRSLRALLGVALLHGRFTDAKELRKFFFSQFLG